MSGSSSSLGTLHISYLKLKPLLGMQDLFPTFAHSSVASLLMRRIGEWSAPVRASVRWFMSGQGRGLRSRQKSTIPLHREWDSCLLQHVWVYGTPITGWSSVSRSTPFFFAVVSRGGSSCGDTLPGVEYNIIVVKKKKKPKLMRVTTIDQIWMMPALIVFEEITTREMPC